ncbi:hypothetical protein Pla22_10380 [Rubripirellula amarantea]|uniref:UPF0229 protein Pla22_10380 n=1 Tax=Rubripirellula amarantea TaxID=2527999 RepID=A0A5C5WTA7_9BACT|nr:YeaH/YhbH family protein [Rubripirellula amarantea]TWT53409.1 hypothetical protein Pla22_10380 [Rubripirellula amarantea]
MHFIDRRTNPKSKNLGNRARFMRRVKSHVRNAVREAIKNHRVADLQRGLDGGEQVVVNTHDIREPSFEYESSKGNREHVLPGNKGYQRGDRIRKPRAGGDSGNEGSPDGDTEDSFVFRLTRDEFLDLFFEELQLPNLAKKKLKSMTTHSRSRAGYSSDGSPQQLNKQQTLRKSLARRIALRRPHLAELQSLEKQLEEAIENDQQDEAVLLRQRIAVMKNRMQVVPFLDTIDLRFNHFQSLPKPTTQAVMFCLMDTSASMTEDLKHLAKQFYMLLHLFLTRHYHAVEIVFIRHTYRASEVDEETFFYGNESGGTVVSSALEEMSRIVQQRYPVEDWNIYAAQASDGHNFDHDMPQTMALLTQTILPMCQYYAYIEVIEGDYFGVSSLWKAYEPLAAAHPQFAVARVTEASDIYPVFHQLFAKERRSAS